MYNLISKKFFMIIFFLVLYVILLCFNINQIRVMVISKNNFPLKERTVSIIILIIILAFLKLTIVCVLSIVLYSGLVYNTKLFIGQILVPLYNTFDYCIFPLYYLRFARLYAIYKFKKLSKYSILKSFALNKRIIEIICITILIITFFIFKYVLYSPTDFPEFKKIIKFTQLYNVEDSKILSYSNMYVLKITIDLMLLFIFRNTNKDFKIKQEIIFLFSLHFIFFNIYKVDYYFKILKEYYFAIRINFIILYIENILFLLISGFFNVRSINNKFPEANIWILNDLSLLIFDAKFLKYFMRYLKYTNNDKYREFKLFIYNLNNSNNQINFDNNLKLFLPEFEDYKTTKSYYHYHKKINYNHYILSLLYNDKIC